MIRLILKLLLYFIIFNIITQPIQSLAFPKSNLDRIDANSLHVNYDEYPVNTFFMFCISDKIALSTWINDFIFNCDLP